MIPATTSSRKTETLRRVIPPMPKREPRLVGNQIPPARDGFSLVEIAMALGIFAFAIIAVLGLMSATISSDKTAAKDTVLAQMARITAARLRSQTFHAVTNNPAYFDSNPDFFFDVSGVMAIDSNGIPLTTKTDPSVFACVVSGQPSPSSNLFYMVMDFRWPADAPTTNQQSRKVTTSVANYD